MADNNEPMNNANFYERFGGMAADVSNIKSQVNDINRSVKNIETRVVSLEKFQGQIQGEQKQRGIMSSHASSQWIKLGVFVTVIVFAVGEAIKYIA